MSTTGSRREPQVGKAGRPKVGPQPGPPAQGTEADVIVVGAGPAGSSTALSLTQAGLEVLLLEKSTFPREKVCGDGLTPRAVRALLAMGVDLDSEGGWMRTEGLRVVSDDARLELDWPDVAAFPSYGLVRTRLSMDDALARHAAEAGAHVHQNTTAVGLIRDERSGRVTGVKARRSDAVSETGEDIVLRAPVVVAADGVSSRLSVEAGIPRRADRPMGVAVRTYFTSPRHTDEYLEGWLNLTDETGRALPGYGWIFGMGDGTCNVGLVLLNAPGANRHVDYRALLASWLAPMPEEWGFVEETRTAPVTGAALPLGFNRTPHYIPGLMLVGDAGGMVNPLTGEGIAYALESGRIAADVLVRALARRQPEEQERILQSYPKVLNDAYGGYFALGRWCLKVVNHPTVMAAAVKHGLSRPARVRFAFTILSNLTDPHGDAKERIFHALTQRLR
ncbi:geranylgeranyl reductase family protein [Demequina sp. TTPB684]|uniref:geranylgeranyl reductase family protein n=1 Tax=unclassified Demequina TaxID=2620311 RepID=UPI001CF111F4|nr:MULTISPECIES: geranylgeranyl reductase family protein [unclassified Demequina]MCB2411384.1 geranylgeranyl reductase family protein [Demequina sp. TTPB684]UPU87796.1 geranylgeranyl reductase family protein [Demequina sp. TMPB413]